MPKAQHIAERIDEAVSPLLASEGYELVLVEYVPASHVLRLYIDHTDRDTGVTIDDCTRVTHLVSDFLDAEGISDAIEGHYTLEVSSPGLDRPLVKPAHFARFIGSEVQVVLPKDRQPEYGGRRKLKGKLLAADKEIGGMIRLDIDGEAREIAYGVIDRARLVPNF